jgi:nitrate/nitrite transporter NarK
LNNKILFSLLMAVNLGITVLNIPPALDGLMVVYDVSYLRISLLVSALFWSHALMQLPGGVLTDRMGLLNAFLTSLSCVVVGNGLSAVFPVLGLAILGRVVAGCGTGLGFICGMKMATVYAPGGKAGFFQAFFGGFFSFGSIVSYLIIPRLMGAGWRYIYIMPAAVSLLLIPVLLGLRLRAGTASGVKPQPLRKIILIKEGWIFAAYHALSFGSLITLGNWVPSLLTEVWKDTTTMSLAWGGALVMLISGFARISGGIVLSRFTPLRVANGSILVLFFLFLGLFFIPTPWLVLTLALLAAWFSSVNFGAIFHMVSQTASPESLGSLIGFINLLAVLCTIIFTLMFGWVKDATGSFSWAFAVLAILSITVFLGGRIPLQKKYAHD